MSGIKKIIKKLRETYPDAHCELDYENPLQLLIATILSAQCTDVRVNKVTPALFAKYQTAKDYANAKPEELEAMIHSTGFYKNKARNIMACCKQIVEEHGGEVPCSIEALTKLAGVGRKTANVVLGNAFGINEGIVVDTHFIRLSNRLGFTTQKDPVKIERELMEKVPQKDWILLSHLLVWHGRRRCKAINPDCPNCEVRDLCPSADKVGRATKKKA